MNTLKFEDYLQSHLGYTTVFTSQNFSVYLAAINALTGTQHFLLALHEEGPCKDCHWCPDAGHKQEAREASQNTITQTLESLTSTLSGLGQRLNWLL